MTHKIMSGGPKGGEMLLSECIKLSHNHNSIILVVPPCTLLCRLTVKLGQSLVLDNTAVKWSFFLPGLFMWPGFTPTYECCVVIC